MFRKYTALAAAMLLATGMTTSLAECAANRTCAATCGEVCTLNQCANPTFGDACATIRCTDPTCGQHCATCWDCNTTCDAICGIYPPADPTAIPQPTPTVQPTQAPSATQTPAPGEDYTTQLVSAQEQKMVNLLNQDRKNNGLSALTLDPELCRIARIKSADMRDNGYFAHESPTYGRVGQMLSLFGYRYSAAGENIAHHANVDKAQAAFMSSQGHRANILGSWTKVGVGIVQDANGYIFATQIFVK